jgi:hypothetical protein
MKSAFRTHLSSRRSEASVGTYFPCTGASHEHGRVGPDTRSLRSLLRDDGSFHASFGHAFHVVALEHQKEDEDGQHGDHRAGHH